MYSRIRKQLWGCGDVKSLKNRKNNDISQATTIQKIKERTVILVFSRNAKEEAKAKKYGHLFGNKGGCALASELIQHTVKEAKKSSLPVIQFYSNLQRGDSFGERLTHAIDQTFAKGYNRIIISGTDAPSINSKQFIDVCNKLKTHQLVLAPSFDGGVYLIGIAKDAYYRQAFLEIPWLGNSVFQSLINYSSEHFFL